MYAEAPLLPARFLPLVQLLPQFPPALIIPGLQFLHREKLKWRHTGTLVDTPVYQKERRLPPQTCMPVELLPLSPGHPIYSCVLPSLLQDAADKLSGPLEPPGDPGNNEGTVGS